LLEENTKLARKEWLQMHPKIPKLEKLLKVFENIARDEFLR